MIFSLAWNTIVYWLLKNSWFELLEMGNTAFLSQKVDGKMIFTEYSTGKFLFWTFRRWEIRSFFKPKSWWKDDIYWLLKSSYFGPWKVLVLNFSERGNTVFIWAKMLMESWYLLGPFELSKIFQDLENMVFHATLFDNDSGDKLLRFITRAIKKELGKRPVTVRITQNCEGVVLHYSYCIFRLNFCKSLFEDTSGKILNNVHLQILKDLFGLRLCNSMISLFLLDFLLKENLWDFLFLGLWILTPIGSWLKQMHGSVIQEIQ